MGGRGTSPGRQRLLIYADSTRRRRRRRLGPVVYLRAAASGPTTTMLWLVTFAAVAQGGIKYLPPKPVSGCSNQCVGGYASTPYDTEGFVKFLSQFTGVQAITEQFSQYHCTKPGLSQIVTTAECTAAAQVVGQSKLDAVEGFAPFCISGPDGNEGNDGTYFLDEPNDLEPYLRFGATVTSLCHCRSCDEPTTSTPSTSFHSPWWTVLGVGLGVCFAGGAIAAARA